MVSLLQQVHHLITATVILDSSVLIRNYCSTVSCVSNSPTPTVSITTTPTNSVTPTNAVTPTNSITPTITPTTSFEWLYTTKLEICCDSTDTPVTVPVGGTVAGTSTRTFKWRLYYNR